MILTSVQVLGIITLGNTFGVNGIASSLVLASSASTVFVFFADKQLKKNDE